MIKAATFKDGKRNEETNWKKTLSAQYVRSRIRKFHTMFRQWISYRYRSDI